jgi:PAS domain S-box-containing protein
MEMRVGELARRTGVGVSTLRAWESRFRFLEPRRSPAGHRLYDDADVGRVEAVLRLVAEGLTLPAAIARVASVGPGALPDGEGEALLFGQILQAADQGIWVSKDGRTRYTNRRMAEIMGYSAEELLAIPVLEFFDPEVRPVIKERTALVRAGHPLHFTSELRRADGSTFVAEITTTPLLDPAGRYDGAVALVTDVTTRNETETQTRLRATLLDSIGEAVTAATPDGKVVYINAAAERLLGWRAGDAVGRDGRELFTAPEASGQATRIHEALLKGKPYSGTLTMCRRDGTEFLAHLTCTPAFDEQRALVGIVAAVTDQTESVRRDCEVRSRERQAETLTLLGTQTLRQRRDPSIAGTLILTEAVDATRRLLDADQAFALDLVPGRNELEVRVASPPLHDPITTPAGSRSFSGYVALARKVVIVDGVQPDHRFDVNNTLGLPPTASAIGAPIFGPEGIVGVLTAVSSSPARFDHRDSHFIQGMANIIGLARLP